MPVKKKTDSSKTTTTKPKKMNAWVQHVKKYAQENNISYKEAITKARATYKK